MMRQYNLVLIKHGPDDIFVSPTNSIEKYTNFSFHIDCWDSRLTMYINGSAEEYLRKNEQY